MHFRFVCVIIFLAPNEAHIVGVDYGEGTPVPIPNTAVKLTGAENTWLETAWENRSMLTLNTQRSLPLLTGVNFVRDNIPP